MLEAGKFSSGFCKGVGFFASEKLQDDATKRRLSVVQPFVFPEGIAGALW